MSKIALTLYFWQLTALDKVAARREAGQGTLEYVGMIAVAAIIRSAMRRLGFRPVETTAAVTRP